jgi:hypothetical protein
MWYKIAQQKQKSVSPSNPLMDIYKIVSEGKASDIAAALSAGAPLLKKFGPKSYEELIADVIREMASKFGPDNINHIFSDIGKNRDAGLYLKALLKEAGMNEVAEKVKKSNADISHDLVEYAANNYPSNIQAKVKAQTFKNYEIFHKFKKEIEEELQILYNSKQLRKENFKEEYYKLLIKQRNIDGKSVNMLNIMKSIGYHENQLGILADDSVPIRQIFEKVLGPKPLSPLRNLIPKVNPNSMLKLLGTGASVAEAVMAPTGENIRFMAQPWLDQLKNGKPMTAKEWFDSHSAKDITNDYIGASLDAFLENIVKNSPREFYNYKKYRDVYQGINYVNKWKPWEQKVENALRMQNLMNAPKSFAQPAKGRRI